MVYQENAKVIDAEELKEIIDEEYSNPTIERLMFVETKPKGDIPSKIFPCYLEAYGVEEDAAVKEDPGLRFQMCLTQSMQGQFSMVRVIVFANELGISKRIWDKPPTKGLRENTPWIAVEGVLQ